MLFPIGIGIFYSISAYPSRISCIFEAKRAEPISDRQMNNNNLLTDRLSYRSEHMAPTQLHLFSYNATDIDEHVEKEPESLIPLMERPGYIHWLQICGLQNTAHIQSICTHFGINFLIMQDILNPNHPCKIEEYEKFNIVIAKYCDQDKESQLSIVQGENFILTFMEYETEAFHGIENALRNNILKIRTRTSDYLLTVLLNDLVSNFISVSAQIDNALEDLESELLLEKSAYEIGIEIQTLRRRYLLLKRTVTPLKEQYMRLIRSDSPLIHKTNRAFFNDLNDHINYVAQNIEICRETLSSLVDLYISNNDLRMNSIMKRLTIVSTIFIPLTFLAGVWGMNFDYMPELSWEYGYLGAWLLMIGIGVGVYVFLKTKKWK